MKDKKTAILLFAREERWEARHKKWRGALRPSEALFRAWNAHTVQKAKSSGLPFFRSTELIRHEGCFEDQMLRALKALFDSGFDHVICIGNDTPGLRAEDLKDAASALSSGKLPVGPDEAGGIYLFGCRRADLDLLAAGALPWQSPDLCDALVNALSSQSEVQLLRRLTDMHSARDIIDALTKRHIDGKTALYWLRHLTREPYQEATAIPWSISGQVYSPGAALRAPPVN